MSGASPVLMFAPLLQGLEPRGYTPCLDRVQRDSSKKADLSYPLKSPGSALEAHGARSEQATSYSMIFADQCEAFRRVEQHLASQLKKASVSNLFFDVKTGR
jgi:hypothetical protein